MSKYRPISNRIDLAPYTLAQELWNSISHGLGAVFGIVALILCLVKITNTPSESSLMFGLKIGSAIFYGISIIVCMTISCVYHSLAKNRGKRVLRVIDHAMIYLLIAGSYAPFCLVALHNEPLWGIAGTEAFAGYLVLGLCYTLIIIGVVFSSIDIHKYSALSMVMYVVGGLTILINPVAALNGIGIPGFILLTSSGAIYIIGSVLYGLGKNHSLWWHTVFHFFVLAALVTMFFSIYLYVF